MQPWIIVIRQPETGERLRGLLEMQGYTVRDIQEACGFANPQAIYRWLRGETIPSVENLLILSRVLNRSMDELLVVEAYQAENSSFEKKDAEVAQGWKVAC